MFRWFRNFGTNFRKPKGALKFAQSKREQNQRNKRFSTSSISCESQTRSTGGRGGGSGSHGEGSRSRNRSSSCSTGTYSRSSSYGSSTGTTKSGLSTGTSWNDRSVTTSTGTSSSVDRSEKSQNSYSRRRGRSRSTSNNTNSVSPNKKSDKSPAQRFESCISRRKKFRNLKQKVLNSAKRSNRNQSFDRSSRSNGRQRNDPTSSSKSFYNFSAPQMIYLGSVSNQSRRNPISSASGGGGGGGGGRGGYSSGGSSSSYGSSSSMSQQQPFQQTQNYFNYGRGRDRHVRRNRNAEYGWMWPDILSPTDRTYRLDRSSSKKYEDAFVERQNDENHSVWNENFPKNQHVIYTDGSYVGRWNVAGIGIFMGPNHELNRSQRIRVPYPDNELAEMIAIRTALENLRDWKGYKGEPVIVRTDSRNSIVALRGENSLYPDIAEQIHIVCKDFPKIEFQHVYAHENDPGNEMADKLATLATGATGMFPRQSSYTRERNRQRSKSNDSRFIESNCYIIRNSPFFD